MPHEVAKLVTSCEGVLLPGSPADVDPQKFAAEKHSKTAAADPGRDNVDELLLQDAHNLHKPVLGICYGLQSLNVWRTGTLVQHIESGVNHSPVNKCARAHAITLEPDSLLGRQLGSGPGGRERAVNSRHHQAEEVAGAAVRVV